MRSVGPSEGVAVHADPRLHEFLAGCYREAGRRDDALGAAIATFREQPTLAAYQALHAEAEPLGRWPEERAAAIDVLEQPAQAGLAARSLPCSLPCCCRRVMPAARGRRRTPATALATSGARSRATARPSARATLSMSTGGCSRPRSTCATTVATTLRSSSSAELYALLAPHGHEAAHATLVAEIREIHRRKRNLTKRLDAQRRGRCHPSDVRPSRVDAAAAGIERIAAAFTPPGRAGPSSRTTCASQRIGSCSSRRPWRSAIERTAASCSDGSRRRRRCPPSMCEAAARRVESAPQRL